MPSSVIHGMLYRPHTRTLDIVFRGNRGAYRYFGVEPDEWRDFKRSPSKGTFLNTTFKAREHRYERIENLRQALSVPVAAAAAPGGQPRDLPDANLWGFYENGFEYGG
jgi:hypothetical protein